VPGARQGDVGVAQVFSNRFTLLLRIAAIVGLAALVAAFVSYRVNVRDDTVEGAPVEQPVPFSHKHHVGDDGIDCRYCHVSVETSAFAGVPPLATCMTCHSQLFTDQPVLAPLIDAYLRHGTLAWNRVHDLPDFAYFDHSIHVAKGVGCSTCHGAIDTMPLTWRVASLDMQWCIACHRDSAPYLRPAARIYDMHWTPPPDQRARGEALRIAYHIRGPGVLTSCSTCHR
jgi:Cytochrome c7 and related cytochrome c/Class III cytochrome C family